jgi:hypothetical protein
VAKRASGRAEAIRLLKQDGGEDQRTPQQMTFAVNYLTFFGYIAVHLLQNLELKDIKAAIKSFQKIFGLKEDGTLTPQTLRAMEGPRCGCPDHIDAENKNHLQFMRAQEISIEKRDRWNKQGLKYFIEKYPTTKIHKDEQSLIFASAFRAWDDVCGLNILECKKAADADIIVSVGSGPQHNFDGVGGTLAWAYLPTGTDQQLTMRFDLEETWVAKPKDRGVLLHNVACHEFGHLLGLTHSKRPSALMAPYYNPFVAVPQEDDDITRIEKLYGKNNQIAAIHEVSKVGSNLTVELQPGQKLTVVCK